MKALFEKDMPGLDYAWISERVDRCCEQIWETSRQILKLGGNVVLDLAFRSAAQRALFTTRAAQLGLRAELHYLDVPVSLRRQRVDKRNAEKDPDVFSFEVTDFMFNFMEPHFEEPGAQELEHGRRVCVEP